MKLNKILTLLLALAMMLSMAACGGSGETTDPADTTAPAESTAATEAETLPSVTVENPVTRFYLSMGQTYDAVTYMNVYENEDGSIYVEYVGGEKKVGSMDASILHGIAAALESTSLSTLNGQEIYGDGEASASAYIEFKDGTSLSMGYSGSIPQEFVDGYTAMDTYFQTLTASLPVYVPQAQVMGEVDPAVLEAMQAIVNNSSMDGLDNLAISDVPMDEFFAFTLGLSSADGIVNGANCAAMMMTTPYSLSIVTVENEESIAAVRSDFEANLGWQKWVCVTPSDALIAQKGNMVLCLLAPADMYAKTAASVEANGWTELLHLENTGV